MDFRITIIEINNMCNFKVLKDLKESLAKLWWRTLIIDVPLNIIEECSFGTYAGLGSKFVRILCIPSINRLCVWPQYKFNAEYLRLKSCIGRTNWFDGVYLPYTLFWHFLLATVFTRSGHEYFYILRTWTPLRHSAWYESERSKDSRV